MNNNNNNKIDRAIDVLRTLHKVVLAEENGSAEHVSEYFSSKEISRVINELGGCIKSNLSNAEIEEAVNDFVSENKGKTLEELLKISKGWVADSDLNKAARSGFYNRLMKKFPKK